MSSPVPPVSNMGIGARRPLIDSLRRAIGAISDEAGIVRRVYYQPLYHDDPAVYWAVSEPAHLEAVADRPVYNNGNAAAATPELAAMKAVGESLERYCAAFYEVNDLVVARRTDLKSPAVDLSKFALFTPQQYANCSKSIPYREDTERNEETERNPFVYGPVNDDTELRWTRARSLGTDEIVFVPAAFVFIPYQYDYPAEPIVCDSISTGLACGSSVAEATYKGLMEVVERDAFMLTWHHRIPARAIELASIRQPATADLLSRFKGVPARLEAFRLNITREIPVVLALISCDRRPYHVVGVAADLSAERALQLAIEEAALGFCGWSKFCYTGGDWKPKDDFSNVDDLHKHALAHAVSPELRGSMDFLRDGKSIQLSPNAAETLSWVDRLKCAVGLISNTGHDVLAVDLTTPDIDNIGFNVVRAVVPGFQPLDRNHNYRYLGGTRLEEFRILRGRSSINHLPHPFP